MVNKRKNMVYRVNYGFRALLDWKSATKMNRKRTTGDLGKPKIFGGGAGAKPFEKQGASRKLPGARGMYFDVSQFKRPAMQKSEDRADALKGNVGQWLYLLSEKMKGESLQAVLTEMDDSRKRWEIEDDEMKNLEEVAFERLSGTNPFEGTEMSLGYKAQMNNDPKFQAMFTGLGVGSNWMASYVANVAKRGPVEIKKLSKTFEKHFQTIKNKGYNVDTAAFEEGKKVDINEQGQTVQEKIGSQGGKDGEIIAIAPESITWGPDFESKRKDYSKPIDLEFIEHIKLPKGPIFKRMDVTSSFLLDPETGKTTGHHGTGVGYKFNMAWTSKDEAEKGIEEFEKIQINKYNDIMKLVIEWEKTKKGKKATAGGGLQSLRDLLPNKSKVHEFVKNDLVPELENSVLTGIHNEISNMGKGDIEQTFIWVMHHMGNMLPGQAENYANTMSIYINGKHGTLILVYEVDSSGMYTAVHANVFEEDTPLQWLAKKALDLGAEGSLDEVLQTANAGIAADGLQGIKAYGVLAEAAEAFMNSVHPKITMGKLIEPQFSAILEEVINKVFENIHKDIHSKMVKGVRSQMLQFSKWAADPANLGDIPDWYEWAASTVLKDSSEAPKMAGDPFWFLWAAPYISGGFPQIGGGMQSSGDHPRMAAAKGQGITY